MAAPVTAVFGLGREVGPAVARRFHERGHRVLAADPDAKRIDAVRESLPDVIEVLHADLDDEIGIRNALSATIEAFDRIDNVVAIPPLAEPDTLASFDYSLFEKTTRAALLSAALTMRLSAERMRDIEDSPASGIDRARQRGTVTFVLSLGAALPSPGRFTESVAQSAIQGAALTGALELAPDRIRVNVISAIRPRAEKSEKWLKSRTPLGRTALADEIGDAAIYLASPEAAIITGTVLTLDGGRSVLNGVMPEDDEN